MEFWGVEVKPGETIKCEPGEGRLLHLSQVALGVAKDKGAEKVPMFVKIDGQKLLLGTLSADNCAQISFDLVFEKDFELFHGSKKTSVCFTGYKSVLPDEEPSDDDMFSDSDSDAEDVNIQLKPNGNSKVKGKEGKSIAEAGKDNAVAKQAGKDNAVAKQKAKPAEQIKNDKPKADDNADEDDSDDDDDEDYSEDESGDDVDMADAMSDSDDDDNDSDEESDEEEETPPMKAASGKKREAESASKTPEKKAKLVTPSGGKKTGGDEKKGGHVATPHPAKKGEKTPASSDKPKQQTPKSATVKCGSCSKTFGSEAGLQAHTKAKHSAMK